MQVSVRSYYLMWAVSTATPSTLTPSSEMMHCVAWPFYHLLRNWVGSSLQFADEHSKKGNIKERQTSELLLLFIHSPSMTCSNHRFKERRADGAMIRS